LYKGSDFSSNWVISDTMRGLGVGDQKRLFPNTSAEEGNASNLKITSTGFSFSTSGPLNFIYVAIRRGPMRVPTTGTSVFSPLAVTNSTSTFNTTGFPIDLQFQSLRAGLTGNAQVVDRLRGLSSDTSDSAARFSGTSSTNAESSPGFGTNFNNTGFATAGAWSNVAMAYWNFRRAPSFFDEVCYTGTGSAQTLAHNLAAVPELIITKNRTASNVWYTYTQTTGATKYLRLNTVDAEATGANVWNNTAPTSTQFTVGSSLSFSSGDGFVAYLFASAPGVSKVGTYTGTGTLTTINCGFTGGARFVLIKKTSNVGSWFVWDTARGMVSGTDPSLRLNVTDAEVNGDSIYSVATGFQLLASPFEGVNTNGDTYVFLAIA
jgi:hypothetical protein